MEKKKISVKWRANIEKNTYTSVQKFGVRKIFIIIVVFSFKGCINLIKSGSKEIYTVTKKSI